MGISGSGDRDLADRREGLARAYVERLEEALSAATHERDLAAERARLAAEGVERLEHRVEGLRADIERERGEAERELERHAAEAERRGEAAVAEAERRGEAAVAEAEQRGEREVAEAEQRGAREVAEADERGEAAVAEAEQRRERDVAALEERLAAREKHLDNAKAGIEARDRRLEVATAKLEARGEELERGRADLGEARNELSEARRELEEARERLAGSERELALRDRDLEARVRELGDAGEELIARERELEAAGTLLEAQGAELARARARADEGARERDELRAEAEQVARERDRVAARLEARERHLANAKAGIESRDRRLEVGEQKAASRDAALASRDAELERLRAAARDRERSLALAESRLEKARQRAEYFEGSLVELRQGKAYRLMRVLWRLRRPFRRTPKRSADGGEAVSAEDVEPGPAPSAAPSLATSSRIATQTRQTGEPLRVASVLDEMSEACFAPECELVPLTLEGWAEQLDQRRPDLLLVESAWNGNGGEWQYRIATYPRKDLAGLPALRALLDGCRERGIPSAFWNKEDPVHFERFAEAAALFDHVFTTDARCVERYRALPGRERTVTPLPFAAQPRIHNPAAVVPERSASPCFAGAWYRDRHADRRRALAALLDAARPRGLVIYDRSFGGKDGAFGFPERFAPHVLGGLPYERILDVYRSHRVFLNANSVADSPTMCSRRVFELAACDTAILSTPGAALSALLGEGTVDEALDEASAAAALERLLGDEPERRRRARAARRKVFAEHTYAARLATIAGTAGLDTSALRREPFARPGEAIGGAPAGDGDARPWQLHLQPGAALSEAALADLAAAARFAEADVIGAHPGNGAAPLEQRRVEDLDPRALLLSRDLLAGRGAPLGDPDQIRAQLRLWSAEGVRLYAADADLLAA